jgi:hypothetical protein
MNNEIDRHKHRNQEAAALNLSTYEWVFDIVPAFCERKSKRTNEIIHKEIKWQLKNQNYTVHCGQVATS